MKQFSNIMYRNIKTKNFILLLVIIVFIQITPSYSQCDEQTTIAAALDFDGVDDYVSIESNTNFNVSQYTIETWVKWGRSGTSIDFISSKGTEFMEIHTGGELANNVRFIPVPGVYLDGGVNTIITGTWTHIACVYNPNIALAKMYINGVDVPLILASTSTNPITTLISANNSPLLIGARSSVQYPFSGQIDEFRFWNKALTQEEVLNHFNCEIESSLCGLIVNQHFNQGFGEGNNATQTTLTDSSGFENNGLLNNFNLNCSTSSNFISNGSVVSGNFCNVEDAIITTFITSCGSYFWSPFEIEYTESGTYSFTNNCITQILELSIVPLPNSPIAESVQTFCNGATIESLIATGEGTLNWYETQEPITPLSNDTVLLNGTYYVSQTIGECESNLVAVEVIVNSNNGEALDFDGINDYVSIDNDANFNVSQYTIETWVKWGRSGTAIDFISSKGYEFMEIHTGGKLANNIRFIPVPGVYLDGGVNAIATGTWTHIACVYNPNIALAKIYINGVDVPLTLASTSTNSITTLINANTSPLLIGVRTLLEYPFSGQIDEFRVWNRALSQIEIQNNMSCEIEASACGLILNQHFNQGFGEGNNATQTNLTDSSSFENNGLLNNFNLNCTTTSNYISDGAVISGAFCTTDNSTATTSQTISACDSYSWSLNNQTYTESGTFTSVNGCLTTILNLTIENLDTSISTLDGTTITANLAGAMYQWIDCNNENAPITEQQNQSFTPTVSGNYAVQIAQGSCIKTSNCVEVSILSTINNEFESDLYVYPNPVNNILNINVNETVKIDLYDVVGKQIFNNYVIIGDNKLDLNSYENGMYFLKVTNHLNQVKTIKILKIK